MIESIVEVKSPVEEGVVSWFYCWALSVRVRILGEATGIASSFDLGKVGSFNLFVQQLCPVQTIEEPMALNVLNSIFEVTISFRQISLEHVFNQTLRILVERPWELYLALQDLLINQHWVIITEGIDAGKHFVGFLGCNLPAPWRSPVHRKSIKKEESKDGPV